VNGGYGQVAVTIGAVTIGFVVISLVVMALGNARSGRRAVPPLESSPA
jgi:hypothetical protein